MSMSTGFKKNTLIEDAKDLSRYGKDFQVKLLSLLIQDRPFTFSILPIIKDIYFTDIYLRNIFTCISEYVTEYHSTPNFDNIRILLTAKGEKVDVYNTVLKSIETIGLEDREFVINNTRNFCFTKHALLEQEKVVDALKRGEFENAKKIAIESFRFSGLDGAKIYDLIKDYEIVFDEEEMKCRIPSPFPTFNRHSKGGPGAGDIVIVVAPSNFGKSAWLVAVARHANFCQKNVAYFTYEIGGGAIFSRYLAGLLNINQEDLKYHRGKVDEKMKSQGMGLLRIIEDKSSNATISAIKNHVEYLKSTGFFTDLIIIDGLNQMKLPKGQWSNNDNDKYEQLTEGVRDLLKELDVPGYCAWQSNRSGFSFEIGTVDGVGKAIEVFQKADQLMFFTQTPEQKAQEECIVTMLKNRLGKKDITLLCQYDSNKGIFIEKDELNPIVFMSSKTKEKVVNTITDFREKLRTGLFDGKK